MKLRYFIYTFLLSYNIIAQKNSIEIGLIRSNYVYDNESMPSELEYEIKPSLIINFMLSKNSSKLRYGVTYQEYNTGAIEGGQIYKWDANYMGPKITYTALSKNSIDALFGISALGLVNGRQLINGSPYNLNKSIEFNGLWFSPSLELSIRLAKLEKNKISLKYSVSNSIKLGDQGNERLRFFNQNLFLVFDIDKSKTSPSDEL